MPQPVRAKMKSRKCSGAVVFRIFQGELEFLLVSSSTNSRRWTFPKGGIETALSAENSALKEVYEEAGVDCEIVESLGSYRFVKGGMIQDVQMFAARYVCDSEDWPEMEIRERKWVSTNQAFKMLSEFLVPFAADVYNRVTAWGLEVNKPKRSAKQKT